MYEKRTYRRLMERSMRAFFQVTVGETDLHIQADTLLENEAREQTLRYRGYLESCIRRHPDFATSLTPWLLPGPEPKIIRDMAEAGRKAGVGPMAAVAGAIAEAVGRELLLHSREVIVENGGDIFLKADMPLTVAVFAGKSPLSLKVGLRVDASEKPVAVCTSSGTVGHSLSMGKADAVCVVSDDCALADAAATSIGNQVRTGSDIQRAIDFGQRIEGVRGLVIVIRDKIGMWGDIEIVPVQGNQR